MTLLSTVVLALAAPALSAPLAGLSTHAQSLFDWSMKVQDLRWDDSYKYIAYADNGPWSTRFTAWYTAGLLQRNEGNDVRNAKAALENIIACQMTESYDSAWYGTFKLSPDEPYPMDELYPPEIYTTYDPNWREFIGTQLVQVVDEFEYLLGADLVARIEDALEIAAVGSMRRNGTFPEDDNLVAAYSNPSLMRAWYVGWIGARRQNATMIAYSDAHATELLRLFETRGADVLSEYNAPTYYGMDIWALAGSIQYPGAANMTMAAVALRILPRLWDDIAAHYNPFLGNMAGPYDRAYTRDMTTHSAIISMFWWAMFGRDHGPQPPKIELDFIYDVAQGAALALVAETARSYVSEAAASVFTSKGRWSGERLLNRTVPDAVGSKAAYRVATSWLSAPLMIGGETVAEDINRGNQFVPAIVHWAGDATHTPYPYVTFFLLYPSASTITSVVGPSALTVSYPNTTQEGTDIFTFALSNVPPQWTLEGGHVISGFDDLPCLNVTVNAPGLELQPVVYGSTLRDHIFYNISYAVPADFAGLPSVSFEFEYTC